MQVFFYILGNNIIPIFTVIFLGFLLNRAFKLDIFTLTKINLYVFVPIFVFVNLYTTPIDFTLIKALIFGIALLATNMAASSWVARIRDMICGPPVHSRMRLCFTTPAISACPSSH